MRICLRRLFRNTSTTTHKQSRAETIAVTTMSATGAELPPSPWSMVPLSDVVGAGIDGPILETATHFAPPKPKHFRVQNSQPAMATSTEVKVHQKLQIRIFPRYSNFANNFLIPANILENCL
jgi:hypothetical protein